MGYQESFLFCKTKKDVTNLCRVLNKAQDELDAYGVYPFFVGKYNKPIHINNFFNDDIHEHSKKGYFVWWGGERHPIQSGDWLYDFMCENFGYDYAAFHCIFVEYVEEVDAMLSDIDQRKTDVIQKNDFSDMVVLKESELIDLNLIKKL